ncbi:outer membrane protein assembly factor BamC [Serpentinimonas raichei]|uniref:outer membrane protein assembly factor BamC n=1 Tax=Serpentinimonas raichei TaxID=1458425 RepID=UPI0005EDDE19|nr:outer membrane protein assembly factor BamC [Serpentinimonas raichei]
MKPSLLAPTRRTALAASTLRASTLGLAAVLVAGCSVLEEDRIDYRSARPAATLEVPPDLTQLQRDSRFVAPGAAVTAAGFQAAQPGVAAVPTAAVQVGDVRIERAGDQRWLVVNRPPEQLWSPIRDFWQENGFFLTLDQQQLGLMETDWAENRALIPQDIIRATLGRLFDTLYSTGERDRFRTRLERRADGGTEIFISHRGMIELFNERRDGTLWQPRPTNHELEAEFLRRLMVQLGVTQEQSQALLAAATPAQPLARIATVNNLPVLQLDEGFDRAWRRVGLALDRTGFTVEDRDRAQGLYFVRFVAPDATVQRAEPGFLGRIFGGARAEAAAPERYRIVVRSTDNRSTVSVLDHAGQPAPAAVAQRIVQVLAEDLR